MKEKKPIFKKSIISLAFCITLGLIYAQKGDKERSYFQSISGVLAGLQNTNENIHGKNTAKFRYLEMDNYPQPFQVFIGKDAGDFKPKFENIDYLKIGDSLTVYFEETNKTKSSAVNNSVYFIDRGAESIFIKGNPLKNLIYGIVVFCGAFGIILIILKLKGKII